MGWVESGLLCKNTDYCIQILESSDYLSIDINEKTCGNNVFQQVIVYRGKLSFKNYLLGLSLRFPLYV